MQASESKPSTFFAGTNKDDSSSNRQRLLIGFIGLAFPFVLWLLNAWRLQSGAHRWAPLPSVSAYYYTGAVSAFAGVLVALAIFLFTYKGFSNSFHLADLIAAKVACFAALGVALFPTGAAEGQLALPWWTAPVGTVHFTSATILFLSFSFFSIFLFTRSGKGQRRLSGGKKLRNVLYIACGVGMLACLGWAGIAELRESPIFWPEALALEFFAVSWLVKGRADSTIAAVAKVGATRIRHPLGGPNRPIPASKPI